MAKVGSSEDQDRRRMTAAEIEALRDTLWSRYRAPLMAYFNRRTGNFDEAEDLAHDVLLRVIQRGDLNVVQNPDAYIFKTARNILTDRAREAEVRERYKPELAQADDGAEELNPERVVQGRQELKRAMAMLSDLTEKTRDMFILKRLEGMKYSEIADLYGISVSAVEKHVIKAIAHLAEAIEQK